MIDQSDTRLRRITTDDGSIITIPFTTPDGVREILKTAKPVTFTEFVYTGNSSRGENSGNYEDREQFILDAFDVYKAGYRDDDLDFLTANLEHDTGIHELAHRGQKMVYHCQKHKGEEHGMFGYTWRVTYRLIAVVDSSPAVV